MNPKPTSGDFIQQFTVNGFSLCHVPRANKRGRGVGIMARKEFLLKTC